MIASLPTESKPKAPPAFMSAENDHVVKFSKLPKGLTAPSKRMLSQKKKLPQYWARLPVAPHKRELLTSNFPEGSASREELLIGRIKALLRKGLILKARELSELAEKEHPNSSKIRQMREVLAPPVAKVSNSGPLTWLSDSRCWLQQNKQEYIGQWVALRGNTLLASGASASEVVAKLGSQEAYLTFVR